MVVKKALRRWFFFVFFTTKLCRDVKIGIKKGIETWIFHKWILCRYVKIRDERALRCQFFTTNFDIKIADEKASRRQFLPKIYVKTSKLNGRKKRRDVPKRVETSKFYQNFMSRRPNCNWEKSIETSKKVSRRPKKRRDVNFLPKFYVETSKL